LPSGIGSTYEPDPPHRILSVLVLLELDAVALQPLHHCEAAGGGLIDGALVDDSVVGAGDLGDVVLWRGLTGDDGVVDAIHAHRQRPRVAHVRLLQQHHLGTLLGGGQRGHRASRATADDEHVAVQPDRVVDVGDFHQLINSE
jgi:hypothetical protein